MRDLGVAIIGMAGRFAGCDTVDDLWSALVDGQDRIDRTGTSAGAIGAWGTMPHRLSYDPAIVRIGGPVEVAPQHGILLEVLHAAIEDAGVRTAAISDRTSLYVSYARTRQTPRCAFDEAYGTDPTFAAPLFSYLNDLHGETFMVDSTCASSMINIRLASQALRAHDCDYALVGTVAIMEPHDGTYVPDPAGIYSRTGYCRPFDVGADGVIPGDGAAALLLRRADDAVRDGDPIHAIIRSAVINNDGSRKAGFVVPSVDGKIEAIGRGLKAAGLSNHDIGYYEAHGVGIPLNDQIEATAVREAFGEAGPALAVGSVKATIGHTDACAAVASVIKTAMALSQRVLPATPNTQEAIPALAGGRFQILPRTVRWDDDRPRRAAVMSAGIGGTNGVAILEAAA
jgi:acyl transferase domain-containing protein